MEEEILLLEVWKKYWVLLNCVDMLIVQDIEWLVLLQGKIYKFYNQMYFFIYGKEGGLEDVKYFILRLFFICQVFEVLFWFLKWFVVRF